MSAWWIILSLLAALLVMGLICMRPLTLRQLVALLFGPPGWDANGLGPRAPRGRRGKTTPSDQIVSMNSPE